MAGLSKIKEELRVEGLGAKLCSVKLAGLHPKLKISWLLSECPETLPISSFALATHELCCAQDENTEFRLLRAYLAHNNIPQELWSLLLLFW